MHCADRKKAFRSQAKIPSPKAILHGFLPVTLRVLKSYDIVIKSAVILIENTTFCHYTRDRKEVQ